MDRLAPVGHVGSIDGQEEVVVEEVSDMAEIRELNRLMENLRKHEISPGDFHFRGEAEGRSGSSDMHEENEQPLFIIKTSGNSQHTADSVWELLEAMVEIGRQGIQVNRYKGLAEMNSEQLQETTMDPEERILLQVKLEDVVEADRIFTALMGDNTEPRREFIEKYGMQGKLDLYGA